MIILMFLFLMFLVLPGVVGFHAYAVTSGSMNPTLPVGALIWIREKKDIQEGEMITFRLNENVVTHRVMEVLDKGKAYITKGDANESNDMSAVSKEQVLGCVHFIIPNLGFAAMMLGMPAGKLAAIALFLWLMWLESLAESIQVIRRKEYVEGEQKKMGGSSCDSGGVLVGGRTNGGIYDTYAGEVGK